MTDERRSGVFTPSAPRVTIVDDDRAARSRLRGALEEAGCEVTEISSGLRLISSLQVDRPDLVVLEAILSWMNGIDLCRALKKHPDFQDIPILFLSTRSDPAHVAAGRAAGCADYLSKPLDADRLRERVHAIIGKVHDKRRDEDHDE